MPTFILVDLANTNRTVALGVRISLFAVGLVLFVQCCRSLYSAIVARRINHLDNLPLVFNCPLEVASFGISSRKGVDDTPTFPVR